MGRYLRKKLAIPPAVVLGGAAGRVRKVHSEGLGGGGGGKGQGHSVCGERGLSRPRPGSNIHSRVRSLSTWCPTESLRARRDPRVVAFSNATAWRNWKQCTTQFRWSRVDHLLPATGESLPDECSRSSNPKVRGSIPSARALPTLRYDWKFFPWPAQKCRSFLLVGKVA
jgi:hypothetical protein